MRNLRLTPLKAAILLLFTTLFSSSINSQPVLGFSSVVTGLTQPVDIVAEPGSSRFFIVQQTGTIRIVNGSTLLPGNFLDISSLCSMGGERGLLSLAFHPDYLNPLNRCFYVYYTNTLGAITIARYQRDASNANAVDMSSGRVLLTISKNFANHNGGKLNFGPDGHLYFGTGDGGDGDDPDNNSQNGNSLLGKLIRLNVDNFDTPPYYTIPAGNPFTLNAGIRDEVWALGLRNPWRWSFDRATGDVWIADVGQGAWEEVNHVAPNLSDSANYGWRCREGMHANPNPSVPVCTPSLGTTVNPIFEYGHNNATGGFSITGGYVYRGSTYPALNGYYVCADYVSGNTWIVRADGFSRRQAGLASNISGFGESNTGELYAVSRGTGALFQVIVTSVLPVSIVRFTGKELTGVNELRWTTAMEDNTQKFIVEYSLDGRNYLVAGEVASTRNSNGDSYLFNHAINNERVIRYRLRIEDIDASSKYSPTISIGRNSKEVKLYPTVITNNIIQVISGPAVERVEVFTITGQQVHVKDMSGASGYFTVPIPSLQKGTYLVRLTGRDFQQTEKIVVE
jgi:glucose/arabinose dehydrogenase